jgi:hypothetical protein
LEKDVGRVQIRDTLQSHAIRADLSCQDVSGSAHSDGHVGLDGALDHEPIRNDGLFVSWVDYFQVIQAVRCIREIERSDDASCIQHLIHDRFVFGESRPHQFHNRVLVEAGATDRGRDIFTVAAGVGIDADNR